VSIRIGFVGVGSVSRGHRNALERMDDVDIVAVCDTNGDRARAAAEEHEAKAYAEWQPMLKTESLDALYICVPPFAHGEMEQAAVERGLPMFIEKPVAIDWPTAVPIARAVDDAGLTVAVGYHWRYSPATERAKAYLDEATLAALVGAWAGGMPGVAWWRRRDGSGGQVIEQSTHIFDLVRHLSGAEPTRVFAAGFHGVLGKKVENYSIDDASVAAIQLDSGVVASLTSACMLPIEYHADIDALTDRGVVRLGGDEVTIEQPDQQMTYRNPRGFSPHARGTEVFVEAVRAGDASAIRSDYADAVQTFALTCAVQASIDRGEAVDLAEFAL
jgi:myo-inositol 2-dehydrogenase/D-chiro-inositol 1-dehydrogenase